MIIICYKFKYWKKQTRKPQIFLLLKFNNRLIDSNIEADNTKVDQLKENLLCCLLDLKYGFPAASNSGQHSYVGRHLSDARRRIHMLQGKLTSSLYNPIYRLDIFLTLYIYVYVLQRNGIYLRYLWVMMCFDI